MRLLLFSASLLTLGLTSAQAQPIPRMERNQRAAQVNRSAGQSAVFSAGSEWDVDHQRVCGKYDESVLALRVKISRAREGLTAQQRSEDIQPQHIQVLRADIEKAVSRANECNAWNRLRRQRRINEIPQHTKKELEAIPPIFRLPEEEAAIKEPRSGQ